MAGEWHALPIERVFEALGTGPQGLSEAEAERRLRVYGRNVVEAKRRGPLLIFASQFANPLIGLLLAATAISLALGEVVDALVIFAVVLLMGAMGFAQEYRAEKAIEALKRLSSPTAKVVRGGRVRVVDASLLVPGDVILLAEGDRVPADARLVESHDLEVDESPITGESAPVPKDHAVVLPPETPLPERSNMVHSGSSVVRGRAKAVVVATGRSTFLGSIARRLEEVKEEKTPLEAELEDLGKKLGAVVLAIAGAVFAATLLVERAGLVDSLLLAVSLAVAAVPEGLPAIATGLMAIGARKMAERRALVRKLAAIEALGSVDVICSDKTGTITKGEMMVKYAWTPSGEYEFTGVGFEERGEAVPLGEADRGELEFVASLLAAHTAGEEGALRPPTELAMRVMAVKVLGAGGAAQAAGSMPAVKEVPFDRFRKRRCTIHRIRGRAISVVTGAPEVVLSLSRRIRVGGVEVELDEQWRRRVLEKIEEYARRGFRTVGVAYKHLDGGDPESDLTYAAVLAIIDPPREGVREAVEAAKRMGVRTIMLTGDHKLTAVAVAKMIGLEADESTALEGWQLDRMSDEELAKALEKVNVFARVTPEHKLRIVRLLKKMGHRVAMTGDGVNDAPALKEADVGVAMGVRGTDVARGASDLILLDDNYTTIVEAIKMGRWIYENLKKPINYLLSCNLGEVAAVFGSELLGLPVILEPVQLLWINVTTDALPALALGLEPPEPGLFERPPRPRGARLIGGRKLAYLSALGAAIGASAIALFALFLQGGVAVARTAAFTGIALSEFGRALTSRSERVSFLKLPHNPWLAAALAASAALQLMVLYTPLSAYFHAVPLDARALLLAGLLPAAVAIGIDEARKALRIAI